MEGMIVRHLYIKNNHKTGFSFKRNSGKHHSKRADKKIKSKNAKILINKHRMILKCYKI